MKIFDFMKKKKDKKGPTAQDWLDKIKRADEVKKRWWKENRIDMAYAYYGGRQRPEQWNSDEWITVNLIYSTINAELPSLYSDNPEFHVQLKRSYSPDPADIAAYETIGKLRGSMLNYLKDELKLRSVMRQMVFDSLFAFGVVKIHASVDMEENPDAGAPYIVDGVEMLDDNGEPMTEPESLPANEEYHVTHIHPLDFLVDENAGPIEMQNVDWMAHVIKKDLEEVKNDERYDKKARENLRGTALTDVRKERETRKKGSSLESGKTADTVILYEIYDLKKSEWLTVAEGCSDFLRAPEEIPDGVDGHPFVTLRLNLCDDTWYPPSHVGQLLDSQREYNYIRSYKLRHRKNVSARIFDISGAAFEDPQGAADALALGQDGTVIIHDREIGYAPIQPVKDAPLDQAMDVELAYLKQDFSDLAIGSNQRGSGAGIDSATEAGIIERRQQVREGDRRALVAEAVADVGRKLDQLVQATITTEQVIRITGPEGAMWQVISPDFYDEEKIRGEYDYSVDYSTALPHLPEIERAQLMQLFTTLASFPHIMLSQTLVKKLAELYGIGNEQTVKDIISIGQQIMSGQLPPPTNGGSPAGPGAQPAQAQTGAAMGPANMRGGQ